MAGRLPTLPPNLRTARVTVTGFGTDHPLYDQLVVAMGSGGYPTANYAGLNLDISLVNGPAPASPRQGLRIQVLDGGPAMGELASSRQQRAYVDGGADFQESLKKWSGLGQNKVARREMIRLLGQDFESLLRDLSRPGQSVIKGMDKIRGVISLGTLWNSFSSCASHLVGQLKEQQLLVADPLKFIRSVVSKMGLEKLTGSLLNRMRTQGHKPLPIPSEATGYVNVILGLFDGLVSYLPRWEGLAELFWHHCTQLTAAYPKLIALATRLRKAKEQFDQAYYTALGPELYRQLTGPAGEKLLRQGGQYAELAVGGAALGTIPFLVGTIYQIVYDILNLVYNLGYYAFWSGYGLGKKLLRAASPSPRVQAATAEANLLSWFAFDFDPTAFAGKAQSILNGLIDMVEVVVEGFIANATELGTGAGKLVVSGGISLVSGVGGLIIGDFPSGGGLIAHATYIIRQWFNIGCVLGPLVVDIILLFCSGGTSGVFSLAAKAGKLGKAADFARFATKIPKLLEGMKVFTAITRKVPRQLVDEIASLIHQLWALVSKLSDQLYYLLKKANGGLADAGKAIPETDLLKVAEKLDKLYDTLGLVDIFAGLVYLLIGEERAVITAKAEVSTTDGKF